MEFGPLSTNSPSKHPLNGTSRPELQLAAASSETSLDRFVLSFFWMQLWLVYSNSMWREDTEETPWLHLREEESIFRVSLQSVNSTGVDFMYSFTASLHGIVICRCASYSHIGWPSISFVDFEGRTLFTDVKESTPGDTSETPIILDKISGDMTAKSSSSPTLDTDNANTPLLKVGRHYLSLTVLWKH